MTEQERDRLEELTEAFANFEMDRELFEDEWEELGELLAKRASLNREKRAAAREAKAIKQWAKAKRVTKVEIIGWFDLGAPTIYVLDWEAFKESNQEVISLAVATEIDKGDVPEGVTCLGDWWAVEATEDEMDAWGEKWAALKVEAIAEILDWYAGRDRFNRESWAEYATTTKQRGGARKGLDVRLMVEHNLVEYAERMKRLYSEKARPVWGYWEIEIGLAG